MHRRPKVPRRLRPLPLLALLPALTTTAAETGSGTLTESDYLGELPSVLTATRLTQPALEAPTSISVIDGRTIRAAGARDVAELLRLIPGFQVEYDKAHRPVATYHGLADDFARRLQVLVDGRSVYTPIFGGVLWSSLPVSIEDIERVEVIRAPNAASYGPNSFFAIVNIITAHAAGLAGGEASATIGQRDQRDAFARASGHAGGGYYRMSYEHHADDGFVREEDHPDGRDVERLAGRYDLERDGSEFTLKGGMTLATLAIGDAADDPARGETDIARRQDIRTAYAQARWSRAVGDDARLSLQYYANYDRWLDNTRYGPANGFQLPGLTNPRVQVDLNVRSMRHDLEAVYTDRLLDELRVVAGAGARRDTVESRWLFGTEEPQTNQLWRLFGHAQYDLPTGTTLHLGALVEDNDIVDTTTSPRLALVQQTAPYHRLRMSVSWATRTPVLYEQRQRRYFDIFSDDSQSPTRVYTDYTEDDRIEPEAMRALELGYRIEPPGRHWGLDVKLLREEVDDLIVEVPTSPPPDSDTDDPVTGFTNGFSGRLQGIEGELSLYLGRDLDLRVWGSRLSIDQVRAVSDGVRDDYVASVPHTTAGLIATYRVSPTRTLSMDYYYIDRMSWVDTNGATATDRLDLQYREEWPQVSPSAFVALRLNNLLGEYAEYEPRNIVDTRLSLQAGLRF